MKIGWIGLGKVGLPMALGLAYQAGCEVYGYDVSPWAGQVLSGAQPPPAEESIEDLLRSHKERPRGIAGPSIALQDSIASVMDRATLVYVCVQTPHEPQLDGTQISVEPDDFEYGYLVSACREIAQAAAARPNYDFAIVVVSTTLPGTMERRIRPLLPPNAHLVYSPSFIALGRVVHGFLDSPSLILAGAAVDKGTVTVPELSEAHRLVWPGVPVHWMSLTSAEMAKMASNAYQTMQITYINEIAWLCDQTGANISDVLTAIYSNDIAAGVGISPGMPDGGPCRPRDLLAMAWLADRYDFEPKYHQGGLFGALARSRQMHAQRLAELLGHWRKLTGLPITVLGESYKANHPSRVGSPTHLVMAWLDQFEITYRTVSEEVEHRIAIPPKPDPHAILRRDTTFDEPAIYLIGANHTAYADVSWPAGSVVIDPWGDIPAQPGVVLVQPGWVQ